MRASQLLLAFAAVLGCSGGGSGDGDPAAPAAAPDSKKPHHRYVLSLEILPASAPGEVDAGGLVEVALVKMDETGSSTRDVLGEFPGPCTDVSRDKAGGEMKVLLAADCTGGEGLRLRVVRGRGAIVLMKATGLAGGDGDYDEAARVPMSDMIPVSTEIR